MKTKTVSISLDEDEKTSGIICLPEPDEKAPGGDIGTIVAHGAANDMNEPCIVEVCEGLALQGTTTLRFNFSYRERGKKTPDPQAGLESQWLAVRDRFEGTLCPGGFEKTVVAGKSMGGRVASQLVSSGRLKADGLILLGYPLHAPGRKESLRDAHLYDISIPTLFVEGTRDPFCDLSLLEGVLEKMTAPWRLKTIEGADHSYRVPKSDEAMQDQVYETVLRTCADWIRTCFR